MTKTTNKLFWILALIIALSAIYTSYNTLVRKDIIIIERPEK